MSELDVSELWIDADVGDTEFSVIRRREVVNGFGETTMVEERLGPFFASIYPTGDNRLARQAAFEAGRKTITIVTEVRLRTASKDGDVQYQPDLVRWADDWYLVVDVKDYTRYGAGFVEVVCTSTDFIDEAPQLAVPQIGETDFSNPAQSGLIGAVA